MKAIIFAAGLGTRLKPFTEKHPKALVPVGGIPMLERVISKLKTAGVTEIVVNVHHFASQIKAFLAEHNNFDLNIEISDESQLLLDTGGGLAYIYRHSKLDFHSDEPIIVHNADILTDFDVSDMVDAHLRQNSKISVMVDDRRNSTRRLLFDEDMKMRGWVNLNTAKVRPDFISDITRYKQCSFGGVHIINADMLKAVFDYNSSLLLKSESNVSDGVMPFSIMDYYIEYCSEVNICGYIPPRPFNWFDIGKPETLERARAYVESQKRY